MTDSRPGWRVGILGATGAVGRTFLLCLESCDIPIEDLRLFASERSAGTRLSFRGDDLVVQAANAEGFRGLDLVLMSAGARASETWAPAILAAGAWAVDNSSRFRLAPEVPLVVAEVNPDVIPDRRCLIANPNCSAMQLLVALKPLHDAFGLEEVWVSTYQSASGKGQAGLVALEEEIRSGRTGSTAFAHPLHMNVIPEVGAWRDDGWTEEEEKVLLESRKILRLQDLPLHVTCVRVPVRVGHSEAVYVVTRREPTLDAARAAFMRAPGIVFVDGHGPGRYPVAREAAGTDPVHVGRLRRDRSTAHGLHLWVVADNLRKGAALNAVQIAELLWRREAQGP